MAAARMRETVDSGDDLDPVSSSEGDLTATGPTLGDRRPEGPRHPGRQGLVASRFRIETLLGRGGMGEVCRAEDLVLGQPVALKFLPKGSLADAAAARRLRDEVRLARRVSHPNVCRVHDVGEADGEMFVSMELIPGEDLASLLRRIGRLPSEKALEIGRQVAAALAAAHAASVLHRDLKPANVMLDAEGRARLTDFGLAVARRASPAVEVGGTLAYMAPELLAGGSPTAQSDLFSLGVLLYELLTGRRPVVARGLAELREKLESADPPPPSAAVPELEPRVERVILRCLARDPAARPQDALAVLADLYGGDAVGAALLAGQTPSPSAVAASGVTGPVSRRVALACLLGFAASLPLGPVLYGLRGARLTTADLSGLPYPPAVLALRARETLSALGVPEPHGRPESTFAHDRDALRYVRSDPASNRWERVRAGLPAVVTYVFRKGMPPADVPVTRAAPVTGDPPSYPPGSVSLRLAPNGRLLRLIAGPDPNAPPGTATPETLLPTAARLAGLDPSRLEAAEPLRMPSVFADRLSSWSTTVAEHPETPLHLTLATYRGSLVFAEVSGPWTPAPASVRRAGFSMVDLVMWSDALVLVAGLVLARRNLVTGRGDRRGALRLATAVFAFGLSANLLRAELGGGVGTMRLFTALTAAALYDAATVWVFYIALEPHVRRAWPECLVSWVRLLSGRLQDPLVGRDVLLAVTVYQGLAIGSLAILAVAAPGGFESPGVATSLAPLAGTRFFLAALADAPRNGIMVGTFYLLVLLLVRTLLRGRMAAPVFAVVLFALTLASFGLVSGSPFARPPVAMAAFHSAGLTLILVRLGLLPMVVITSLFDLAVSLPLTFDLDAWYADRTLWAVAIVLGLAVWAYRVSQGKRTGGDDPARTESVVRLR
jgi:serine/threonine-protein kinase